jgi:carboxyl-terminal processing protease
MKYKISIIISVALLLSFLTTYATDSYYYKVNKAFEVFGEFFREITTNYVIDVDPEYLMNKGIEGMLADLDPYTVYMSKEETDDIDIITNGKYTGFGITVAERDSMIAIVDIMDGFSAQRTGLRIGDRIYSINSENMVNKTPADLRKYSRGKIGESVKMRILRGKMSDTINLDLAREEIKLKNVTCAKIIDDQYGYIKIERFARKTAAEVRTALYKFKRQIELRGVIIDLRDNPGGLLEASVEVAEIFLPVNSLIVTTRGRANGYGNVREYNSVIEPMMPEIPLAVLINGGSASASEVLAGCFQDLDRAVVLGETSYGKGLVQTVVSLPHDNSLKITTARYYTPSGRCIQKYEYHDREKQQIVKADSIVFLTRAGREVVEALGIIPDSVIKAEVNPKILNEITSSGVLFDFASDYCTGIDSLEEDFVVNKDILAKFHNYLESEDFIYITEKKKHGVKLSKLLDYEISRRFFSHKTMMERIIRTDGLVKTASELLGDRKYKTILSINQKYDLDVDND